MCHLFHLHVKQYMTPLIKEPPESWEEEADTGITSLPTVTNPKIT